ncbi:hypothetical protein ACIGG9_24835 [Pseudonocardia alni]|uniref:hypothetical protein n=1 Tax=Pseudonocardia alni TaxID=33907 RepID=UPI0033E319A1
MRLLGEKYIPLLDRRLGDVAGGFNTAAIEVSQYLRSTRGLRSVDTALANTSKTTDQLARAAAPLTEVFVRFGEIGSEYLTPLASKFADAAERARDFVDSTEGAKKIRGWIENGLTALS